MRLSSEEVPGAPEQPSRVVVPNSSLSDINLLLPHSWGSFFQFSDQDLGLELLCIVGHVLPMFRARRQEDYERKKE